MIDTPNQDYMRSIDASEFANNTNFFSYAKKNNLLRDPNLVSKFIYWVYTKDNLELKNSYWFINDYESELWNI